MSDQVTPQRPVTVPTNPDLKSLLDLLKQNIFSTLNCHAIGTVQAFSLTDDVPRVQVQLAYKKTQNGKAIPYPVLVDCPLVVLSGGVARLTFPIAVGDPCLVLFNDRDIDLWFAGATDVPPQTARMHSLTDAIALVGLRSITNPLPDYDQDHVVLQYGESTKLALTSDEAQLTNGHGDIKVGDKLHLANDSANLIALIDTLFTVLDTLLTAMSSATPPTVVAAIATPSAAAKTALLTLKTQFEGLLE